MKPWELRMRPICIAFVWQVAAHVQTALSRDLASSTKIVCLTDTLPE
jgi:hypothetical protein